MSQPEHESNSIATPGSPAGIESKTWKNASLTSDGISVLQRFKQCWRTGPPPDLQTIVAASRPLSNDDLAAIVRADLYYRWMTRRVLPVEWYFEQFERLALVPEIAVDLIYAEFLQAEKHGPAIGQEEIFLRFPQHQKTLRDQLELHRAICSEDTTAPLAAADSDADRLEPLKRFPRIPGYQILDEVGRGGIGVVYRAHDPMLNRTVALKLLLSGAHASAAHLRRFQVEAEAAARLQHRNIVQIHEIGEHDGRPYLALEFVSGANLAERYRGQPQEPRWSAILVEQLARTIEFAHQHGVIHRDLKPANVLFVGSDEREVRSGQPGGRMESTPSEPASIPSKRSTLHAPPPTLKITDFGLAKLSSVTEAESTSGMTRSGDVLGTPSYMAPEQAAGRMQEIGVQTDVYALGAILYGLLTGRPPFVGATPIATMRQVIESEPVHPSRLVRQVPPDLQTICLKCLEKEPSKRYSSALALAEDLSRFLNDRPILARRATLIERGWRWCRRNSLIATLLGSIAALITLVAIVATVSSIQLTKQLADTARAELAERRAKTETMERLWDASLAEARAHRTSRRLGQRFAGLEAIAQAKALSDSVALTADRRAALRNSAIACLALPDLRKIGTWRESYWPSKPGSISDGNLSRYVCQTTNGDVEVRVVGDGNTVARLRAQPPDSILELTSDGRWLSVRNERFQVWRIDGPEPKRTLDESVGGWWSFSPDSRFVVGSTVEGNLRVHDLNSDRPPRDLGQAQSDVPLAISPDGTKVALVVDETIRVIDLRDGRLVSELEGPSAPPEVTFLSWNPKHGTLLAAPYPDGIREWDVRTGAQHSGFSHEAAFLWALDETGELFISHSPWDGLTRLWDTRGGKPWLSIPGFVFYEIKPTPGGGFRLIVIQNRGDYELWEVAPQRIYHTAAWTPDVRILLNRVSVSPDGRLVAISATNGLSIINARGGSSLAMLEMGRNLTDFSADGQLITASSAGLFRWSRRQPDMDASAATPSSPSSVEFMPPESPQHADSKQVGTMAVSRDGRMIAVVDREEVLVWRVDHPDEPRRFGPHDDVRSLAFSPDGKWLASGGWASPGGAKIWDLTNGRLIKELALGSLCAVAFSPDGRFLVSSPRGGELWRTSDWTRHVGLRSPDTLAAGMNVEFSPDGSVLAVATSTGMIRMVDPETGRDLLTLTDPHQHRVRGCEFSADGSQLVTITNDDGGAIHIWDLRALGEELDRLGLLWKEDLPETTFGLPQSPSTNATFDGPLTVTFGHNEWINRMEEGQKD